MKATIYLLYTVGIVTGLIWLLLPLAAAFLWAWKKKPDFDEWVRFHLNLMIYGRAFMRVRYA